MTKGKRDMERLATVIMLGVALGTHYERRQRRERLHRKIEDVPIIGDLYWSLKP